MAERSLSFFFFFLSFLGEQTVPERRSYYLGAAIVVSAVSVSAAGPETQKW